MVRGAPLAAAAGVAADMLLGERWLTPHPVGLFGRVMTNVERRAYRDDRLVGAAFTATGVGVGIVVGRGTPTLPATYVACGGRMLGDTALAIASATEDGDLATARALLPALVGRDPADFDEKEVCRAAVESVAENTVDAVVAPALWAAAAGGAGALGYRALNTLDSMVGHRSPRYARFGSASARADDAAGWVPARVTAALVAAVRPARWRDVLAVVRRDAPAHPSPNAGVAEAAFAAALGLRLGGTNRYDDRVEHRPFLGNGRPPEPADVRAAVVLSRHVALALASVLVAGGLAARAGRGRRHGHPLPTPHGAGS